jgi:hypothetical protein
MLVVLVLVACFKLQLFDREKYAWRRINRRMNQQTKGTQCSSVVRKHDWMMKAKNKI